MAGKKDKDTRCYIDLDLRKQLIIGWGHGNRHELLRELGNPFHHRVFITEGQYNKLNKKNAAVVKASRNIRSVD